MVGGWPGLHLPETQMLEDLLYDLIILFHFYLLLRRRPIERARSLILTWLQRGIPEADRMVSIPYHVIGLKGFTVADWLGGTAISAVFSTIATII